jgi:hypothetical protein
VVTVFPSLNTVRSWEEVLVFSMDLCPRTFEFVLQDANLFEKASLCFCL